MWCVVLALLAQVGVRLWLNGRQMRHVARHRDQVPSAYADAIDLAAHQKAADYTLAKARLVPLEVLLDAAVLLAWTLLGGLMALNQGLLAWMGQGLWQQVVLVLAFVALGALPGLPLSWWQTFRIEARWGFNQMTQRLWWSDLFKGALLGLMLGLPLVALVLWLMQAAGALWWLWAWGALVLWQAALMVVAPRWIMPLFNRFEPLQDAALAERSRALMARAGFEAQGFFVMDGSKRSTHSNAFFTGLGRSKRVVFFDTLLAQLDADEMQAVLAHELGHFHHRHLLWRLLTSWGTSLLGLALLGWLAQQTWFYTGLGVVPSMTGHNEALALLLFLLVTPVFGFFLAPWSNARSRQHEFEADAYARAQTDGAALRRALLKLYRDNASTLTPDPLYVRFYFSHPPASERLQRLQGSPA